MFYIFSYKEINCFIWLPRNVEKWKNKIELWITKTPLVRRIFQSFDTWDSKFQFSFFFLSHGFLGCQMKDKKWLIRFCFIFLQEDIFQLVGVPLVKDALAGYNTSILSYGQVSIEYVHIFYFLFCYFQKNLVDLFNCEFTMTWLLWIFCKTGSGKTYTMWGPPSAMVEGQSTTSHLGIVPRIFQMLFSEIQKVGFVSQF